MLKSAENRERENKTENNLHMMNARAIGKKTEREIERDARHTKLFGIKKNAQLNGWIDLMHHNIFH